MKKRFAQVLTQEILTECEIDAPASKGYSVISDFSNFSKFTKNIVIVGDAHPGKYGFKIEAL